MHGSRGDFPTEKEKLLVGLDVDYSDEQSDKEMNENNVLSLTPSFNQIKILFENIC